MKILQTQTTYMQLTPLIHFLLFFRYYKLAMGIEYYSLFSTVNTKILMWGCLVFVMMICVAPVYGWGEYSDKRGNEKHTLFKEV